MAARALVTVVGSLHYDVMVEAPDRPRRGETVVGSRWWPKCGGKGGNQAVEARLAGASVRMVGAVGDDDFGRRLLAHLDAAGVDHRHVRVVSGAASGMSVAILDAAGDYGAVIVSGANGAIGPDVLVPEAFAQAAVVVLQNEIPSAANREAARLARAAGAIVVLNAAPAREGSADLFDAIDILVVNAIEAEMLGAGTVVGAQSALAAARFLAERVPTAVVTAGAEGMAAAGGAEAFHLPAETVAVQSTHGAGDCFVGTLAARLARGDELRAALETASMAAGRLVATPEAERSRRLPAA